MSTYADTNALVRLFLQLPGSEEAQRFLRDDMDDRCWPLPVPTLLRLECVNAVERMVFESRSGGTWRVTPESAALAQEEFASQLAAANFLYVVPLELSDLADECLVLAAKFTAKHGFRTYDLIHVASALALGCQRFLSFDAKANSLARLVGLKTL